VEHQETLLLAGIVALGICCQWLAWRLKLPAILPLLGAGFLLGPVLNILHPQELLGDLFFPFIGYTVSNLGTNITTRLRIHTSPK
jgi:CPA1 family monovalent cation:H+ antiporter